MKINQLGSKIRASLTGRSPLARAQAEKARREFNVWAREPNRQGRRHACVGSETKMHPQANRTASQSTRKKSTGRRARVVAVALTALLLALALATPAIDAAEVGPADQADQNNPGSELSGDPEIEVPSPLKARLVFACVDNVYADVWIEVANSSPQKESAFLRYLFEPGTEGVLTEMAQAGTSTYTFKAVPVGTVVTLNGTDGQGRTMGDDQITVACGANRGTEPATLIGKIELVCIDLNGGRVELSATNDSMVVSEVSLDAGVYGSQGWGAVLAPGETVEHQSNPVATGRTVEASIRDGSGAIVESRELTVHCGEPDPQATFRVVCDHASGPLIYVNLGNAGQGPVTFKVEVRHGGNQIGHTPSVTVDPNEQRRLEFHAVDAQVNHVEVFDDPASVVPLHDWQVPVDCSKPGGGFEPRFTG